MRDLDLTDLQDLGAGHNPTPSEDNPYHSYTFHVWQLVTYHVQALDEEKAREYLNNGDFDEFEIERHKFKDSDLWED